MTSGVKQALPQIALPKSGIDGKVARNRLPQVDFAEALGVRSHPEPAKSGDTRPDTREADTRPAWPRLSSQLGTTLARAETAMPKFDIAILPDATAEEEQPIDDEKPARPDTAGQPRAEQTPPLPAVQVAPTTAHAALPASTQAGPPVTPLGSERVDIPVDDLPLPVMTENPMHVVRGIEPDEHKLPQAMNPRPPAEMPSASSISFMPIDGPDQPNAPLFEPMKGSLPTTAEAPATPSTTLQDSVPDATAEPAKPLPRVAIVAQQSVPAPMPSTALVLVDAIAASDLLGQPARPPSFDAVHVPVAHASAQSLKIQLHPAELGMVTATLRFAGEQLSIELQVESHEAYRRLAGDRDTIVGSLRDLGFEVDRVTVLQPSIAASPSARVDGQLTMPSSQSRSPDLFASDQSGGGGSGSGGRSQEGSADQRQGRQSPGSPRKEAADRGIYI